MLLECVSWDSEHVTLRNVEGPGYPLRDRNHGQGLESAELVCTHSFCRANLRNALCFTISSAQGRTIPGTIGLYDLAHPRYTRRHLYTCISRSQAFGNLSCED